MNKKNIYQLLVILIITVILSGCSGSNMMNAEGWPNLTVVDETVYVANLKNISAVDINTGSEIMHLPEESKSTFYAEPAITDDLIIVGDYENILHAFNRKSGAEQWNFSGAKGRWIAGVLVVDSTIYAPCADYSLYALDLDGKLLWSYKTDEALWAKPFYDGTYLYQSSMDHYLYALNLETQKEIWKTDLGGALVSSPTIDDAGTLYIGTLAKEVYAIQSTTGKPVWKSPFKTDGSVWASINKLDNILYFGDAAGFFYAVDAKTGQQIWKNEIGTSITASALNTPNGMIVSSQSGEIFLIDFDGKRKIWSVIDNGSIHTTPAISGESIVFAFHKSDNLLMAYDLDGRETWSSAYPAIK